MRMSVLLLLLVGFDAATQELHEVFDVEVVSARRHERFPVAALQYVVGLGVDAVGFQRIVGVDLAETFEHFARIGGHPFVFGQDFLVVGVERRDHVIPAQDIQHLRIGPNAGFHFAAVYAAVAREVDEQRLVDFRGVCFGLLQVEESFESVRQVQEVAVLGFFCRLRSAACPVRPTLRLSRPVR